MSRVSIVVLNWNGKEFLKSCLDSLKKLTYPSVEIIVVDNDSTDGSSEFIKKNYPNVILIQNKKNYGFAQGNNIGYKRATGEYILFLNNDTLVTPDFLSPLVNTFKNDPQVGCIQPQIRLMEQKEVLDGVGAFLTSTGFLYHFGYLKQAIKDTYGRQMRIFSVKGACMFVRRKVIEKVGLFDDDFFIFFEETDFCFRVWLSGSAVLYDPSSVMYHVGGGDTTSSNSYQYERRAYLTLRNALCSYLKNFGTRNLFTVLPIFIFLEVSWASYCLFKFKGSLSIAVLKAFWWNIQNINKTLKKRKDIQYKIRKISDAQLNSQIMRNPSLTYYKHLLFNQVSSFKE